MYAKGVAGLWKGRVDAGGGKGIRKPSQAEEADKVDVACRTWVRPSEFQIQLDWTNPKTPEAASMGKSENPESTLRARCCM